MSYAEYYKHTKKSIKAYNSDIGKQGKITNNLEKWRKNSKYYDYPGIDTIDQPKKYISRKGIKPRKKYHNWKWYRVYKYK